MNTYKTLLKYIAYLEREESLQVVVDVKKCVLNVWDCCTGQEKFDGLGGSYYIDAKVVVLCFNLSFGTFTFAALGKWISAVRQISSDISIIFCGMKSDLKRDPSGLPKAIPELVEVEAKHFGVKFFEISSKTGKGFSKLFLAIAEAGMSK